MKEEFPDWKITEFARLYPHKTAIKSGNQSISYAVLEKKSNRIANFMKGRIKETPHVIIILDRSPDLIESIIGLLKSGLVFVPLNPLFPRKMVKKMIDETRAEWVITSTEYYEKFKDVIKGDSKGTHLKTLLIDGESSGFDFSQNANVFYPGPEIESNSLAFAPVFNENCYIYFTSGSTGIPKGVLGRRSSLAHFIQWEANEFGVDESFNISQFTPPSFDPFLRDIFLPLMTGGTCCIPCTDILMNMGELIRWIDQNHITLIHTVPSLFKNLVLGIKDSNCFHNLRYILLAGELLRGRDICKFIEIFKERIQLVNIYGPTETTLAKLFYPIKPADVNRTIIPVGKPIPSAQVLILDSKKRKCRSGKRGEIYIKTPFISSGYYNDPGLNEKVFIKNPYGKHPGDIIYKTGDLGRLLPDGNIELSGRIDFQVKVRGVRIELGEIENLLLKHIDIKETVVIAKESESDDKYLCAYVAPAPGKELAAPVLREYLSKDLPGYMIPNFFVLLEKMPLTPNGKIDRSALPGPEVKPGKEYTAPRDQLEEKLAGIWSEILGIGKDIIGIDSNFFELGGHSLKATILMAKIHKEFKVKLPLAEVFKNQTIRRLSKFIEGAGENKYASIEPLEKREYYELSSAQKRLYFLQQMDLNSTGYNMHFVLPLGKDIEKDKLESTLKKLIARHESLKTSFEMIGEEPVQRVLEPDDIEFTIEYYDLTTGDKSQGTGERRQKTDDRRQRTEGRKQKTEDKPGTHLSSVIRHLSSEFIRPFDLSRAPLIRSRLIKLPEKAHTWMVDMHHIVSDGTSRMILAEDFMRLYNGKELEPLRLQYKDFSKWQNHLFEVGVIKSQEDYWLELYSNLEEIPRLNLPTDYKRPGVFTFAGDRYKVMLSSETALGFKALGAENGATLYMNILAVLNVLFYKYTGQTDIIIGTGVAGRPHDDLQEIIGMFINTLTMRNYPHGEKTYRSFLKEVIDNSVKAFENQDLQFEELLDKLKVERDVSRNPLFDILMVIQNFKEPKVRESASKDEIPGRMETLPLVEAENNFQPAMYKNTTSKFDMTFFVLEREDGIHITIEYYTGIFKEETVKRMTAHLRNLITAVVKQPSVKLKDIDIIPGIEKKQILYEFNNTAKDFPRNKTIHKLFEEQTASTPDGLALVFEDKNLTYKELKAKAGHMAGILIKKGVRPGNIVGIMVNSSIEMISGLLGILKARCAYLPIDPHYPGERKRCMLADSRPKALVTASPGSPTGPLAEADENGYPGSQASKMNLQVVLPDSSPHPSSLPSTLLPFYPSQSSTLAYILYTSGSTGNPKGVMVENISVIRLVKNTNFIDLKTGNRILQTGALEFDASTFEIWGALLNGLTLYLAPKEQLLDPKAIKELISNNQITTMWMTSALFNRMVQDDVGIFAGLRDLLVGGDALSAPHINQIKRRFPRLRIINGYGPTENTTFSTTFLIDKEYKERIPIGKPIANSSAYIVDKNDQLQPIGIIGELWVGGDGVSRGYLNNPELTAEKFVNYKSNNSHAIMPSCHHASMRHHSRHPFTPSPYTCIYRTGDLARWLGDGNIEFLARIDRQVKIRGFRIEPGEIESQLSNHNMVREAVVVHKEEENGEKYLCAYIVSREGFDISLLKDYLAGNLPAYMIPAYFVKIDKIPLTPVGKVDRKALPAPAPALKTGKAYSPPRSEIEKKLAALWAEVLNIELEDSLYKTVGIDDNFFDLGGHSLKAVALSQEIHKELMVKIPLVEIFKSPTVRELAEYIKGASKVQYQFIEPVEKKQYYPLSSAQKRLYFLQQMDPTSTAYNIPLVLPMGKDTRKDRLESVLKELIARHESLRTLFEMIGKEPVQKIHDQVEFELENKEVEVKVEVEGKGEGELASRNSQPAADLISSFIRPFDLSQAPLIRSGLIKYPDGNHTWMVDIHHIVSDGTSHMILTGDFMSLYNGKEPGPLRLQYKDFSQWQNRLIESGKIKSQEVYWLELYRDPKEIPRLDLLTDHKRPEVFTFEGARYAFELAGEEAAGFKALGSRNGATLYMNILTVLNTLFYKYTDQTDIIIGTGIAGRPHVDLQKIIGMFVNTLALRNYPQADKTYEYFLKEVVANSVKAFENQDLQFEELVDKLEVERDLSRNPLFDISLVVQNFRKVGEKASKEKNPGQIEEIPTADDTLHTVTYRNTSSKFDMTFFVHQQEDDIYITIEYYTSIFKEKTIKRMASHVKNIIKAVVKEPSVKLKDVDMISEIEKKRILYEFNNTAKDFPRDKTIHKLFEEQAARTRDNIAVVGKEHNAPARGMERDAGIWNQLIASLSYKELNKKSHQLAYLLRTKGIERDTIVGLMMERSIEMIIGLIAILKAGGAFLPIDPGYPWDRINYMLTDSNAKVLVTTRSLAKESGKVKIDTWEGKKVFIEPTSDFSLPPQEENIDLEKETGKAIYHPENLAYVIYTSGTSGKPKGVMINHRAILNYTWWAARTYVKKGAVNFLLYTSISFDLTMTSIFTPLLTGNKIVAYGEEEKALLVERIIDENKMSVVKLTPSHLELIKHKEGDIPTNNIKCLIVGGEELERDLALDIDKKFYGNIEIYNEYGPTETAVGCMIYRFDPLHDYGSSVPIGNPISNTRIYILDKYLKPVPFGIAGELCIGGEGVARGYLNQPELTAEKFDHDLWDYQDYRLTKNHKLQITKKTAHALARINKKFLRGGPGGAVFSKSAPPDRRRQKIYKTGDLARWMPDGYIEFMGRLDQQVKIRGFRIELGEIKSHLLKHDSIKEAVVMDVERRMGEKCLCAYIVPGGVETGASTESIQREQKGERTQDVDIGELRNYLSGFLPDYMIPSYFVQIDKIPLTPSGKVDRKVLPTPEVTVGEEYASPRNETERKLVKIWSEVLNVNKEVISIDSNFFEIGGHSLKATILVSKIHKEMNVKVPMAEVLKNQTVSELANYIQKAASDKYMPIRASEKREVYELSYHQKRLWVLNRLAPGSSFYNMPGRIQLSRAVAEDLIKKVLNQLVKRHAGFRTGFKTVNDEPVQWTAKEINLPLKKIDISGMEEKAKEQKRNQLYIEEARQPFDLETPPLFRTLLVKLNENRYEFIFNMHHIISDGWSLVILKKEFFHLYEEHQRGKHTGLEPLKIQYIDFSQWSNKQLNNPVLQKESHEFWNRQLEKGIPAPRLARDTGQSSLHLEGAGYQLVINKEVKDKLNLMARNYNTTLFMVMFSSYILLLSRFAGQQEIVCSFITSGRQHQALHNIIGFFVHSLLFRTRVPEEKSFADFLCQVHNKVMEIFNHQLYPLELVCEKLKIKYPETAYSFNMLNLSDETRIINIESWEPHHKEQVNDMKFDMEPYVTELNNGINISWTYKKKMFKPATIEYIVKEYIKILDFFSRHPDKTYKAYRHSKMKKKIWETQSPGGRQE